MGGVIYDADALRRQVLRVEQSISALEEGLSKERHRKEEHLAHLAVAENVRKNGLNIKTFNPDSLRRAIVCIDNNIAAIEGAISGERKRKDSLVKDLATAEKILEQHGIESPQDNGNGRHK